MLSKDDIIKNKKRFDTLDADTKYVKGVWNELERYVVPYRGRMFTNEKSEGAVDWDKYNHYDSTAVNAASTLAASIHGAVLPNLQWFYARYKNEEVQKTNEYSNWLAEAAKMVYQAIDASNFDLEADELILDLTGFGHGFMVHETRGDDDDDLDFSMVPIKEALFQEGYGGMVEFFYRSLEWDATKIVDKFGYDKVPEKIQKQYDDPQSRSNRIRIVFSIFPRRDNFKNDISKPLAVDERPWGFIYYCHEGNEILGEEGGFYENPVYSVPWRKVSGSQWGHGPGHVSLGDIKQLNQHRLMRTRAVEKAIDPANITTERGLVSNLDLGPSGLTVVRKMDELAPYEGRANFSVSDSEIFQYQSAIKEAFMVDRLQLKESPAMTATEVQVRYELMQRLLGPTMGRMKTQWLTRVVENVFKIELRAGRLPPMPAGLEDLNAEIVIEFVGALATSQKTQQANNMVTYAGEVANLSQVYPDMKYIINADEYSRELANLRNIPEKAINGADEVKKQKSDDAKLIAQQQKLMEAKAEGEAMESQGKGQQAINEAQQEPQ